MASGVSANRQRNRGSYGTMMNCVENWPQATKEAVAREGSLLQSSYGQVPLVAVHMGLTHSRCEASPSSAPSAPHAFTC